MEESLNPTVNIGPISFDLTLLAMSLVTVLMVFAFVYWASREMTIRPKGKQNALEMIYEFVVSFAKPNIGDSYIKDYSLFLFSLFLVILVANSLGRGDKTQMKRIIRESYWISTFLMVLVSGSILLFGQGLSGLFTDNKAAIAASQVVILYSFLGNPVTSGTLVYTAVWQGLGKAKMPFYATTIGMWIIRIFSGYFLGVSLGMGLAGVWIATVVDNVWRAIFLYVMYRRYLVKRKF